LFSRFDAIRAVRLNENVPRWIVVRQRNSALVIDRAV